MTENKSRTPEDKLSPEKFNVNRILWVSIIFTVVAASSVGLAIFLMTTNPIWQVYLMAGIAFLSLVFDLTAVVWIRQGKIASALKLLFWSGLFTVPANALLFSNVTAILAILVVMVGYVEVYLLFPVEWRGKNRYQFAPLLATVFIFLVDFINPSFRVNLGQTNDLFGPAVLVFLIVGIVFVLIRQAWIGNIRTKLIASFLILAVTSVAIVGTVLTFTVQSSLEEQIASSFVDLADSQIDIINSFFLEKVSTLRTMAGSDVIKDIVNERNEFYEGSQEQILADIQALDAQWLVAPDFDPLVLNILSRDETVNAVTFQLLDFQEMFGEHVEIFVTDRYGATVGATNRLSDYYQADEGWWQAAWNHGKGALYISDPEFDESANVSSILIALPILSEETGKPIGILRSTVIVESLYELLQETRIGETGYTLLLDKDANILMNPQAGEEGTSGFSTAILEHVVAEGLAQGHSTGGTLEEIGRNADIFEDLAGNQVYVGFNSLQPNPVSGRVFIDDVGSGAGLTRLCVDGNADIAQASRAIRDSEIEACQSIGRDPIAFIVGIDAVAIIVSGENDFVTDVTMDELAAIFSTADTWSDVRPEWPDEPVVRNIPAPVHGTYDYFVETVFDNFTDTFENVSNIKFTEDYGLLIQDVLSNPYSVGFVSFGHYLDNASALKALSLNGIPAELETVENFDYPLVRPLFLYSDAQIMLEKPQVAVYINHFLTHVNEEVENVGYFPLNQEALNQSKLAWLDVVGTKLNSFEKTISPSGDVVLPALNPADYPGDVVSSGSSTVYRLAEVIVERYQDEIQGRVFLSDQAEEILDTVSGLGWTALVRQNSSEALVSVDLVRRNGILISVGVALFAVLGAVFAAQTLVRPLNQLTRNAQEYAAGDFSVRTTVVTQDEIGTLAQTFNAMANQVGEFIGTLEQRVSARTKALATSSEVSRRLSTFLNPDQLVAEVVEQVKQAFEYYHVHIYLFDQNQSKLQMVGGTGEAGQTMLKNHHYIPAGRGLVGQAAETNQVVLVPDTAADPNWLPNPLLPATKAEVAVPIAVSSNVLGVLDVQHDIAGGLRQEDADLLQTIANQVAIALQNARQYEETQQLFLASQALSPATTYQEMLDAFMTHTAPQADQGGLLVFNTNEDGNLLSAEYAAAWSRQKDQNQPIETGTRFAPEQIPFAQYFIRNQPLIISDVNASTPGPQTTTPEIAEVFTQFGVQSIAGYPLILGGKLLGAILFGYTTSHTFTDRELQPVQAIASQLTVLLRNQQLLAETQATLAQLDVINRRLTGEGWREFTGLTGGLTVEDIVPGFAQVTEETSQNGQSISAMELTVPIAVRGETIGSFHLQHLDENATFTHEDQELLEIVANDVAVALDNIRLIEQTQRNASSLEESRNLLDAIIENLPIHLFVKEAKELEYIRWNKAGEDILGVSASEIIGKTVYDVFSKEDADNTTAQDREVIATQSPLEIEEEVITTPHRGIRTLHTRKTPVPGPDGQPRYLVGLSEDITERKQAEQALRDLESLYRQAIAAADAVPYSRSYEKETFTFIGEGIEKLTGYTVDEFDVSLYDSMILESIVYSTEATSNEETVRMTRSGPAGYWKADYRILGKDGVERWLSDTSIEVLDSDGKSTGSVGILTDITEQKQNEAALTRQLREMEGLNELGRILTQQTDLEVMLVQAGQKICEAFNVDTGTIVLYDSRSEFLNVPFCLSAGERVDVAPQAKGVSLVSRVIDNQQPLLISEMTDEITKEPGTLFADGVPAVSWLGAPVVSGGEVIGVVSVEHIEQPNWFKEDDVGYLTTIATSLSTAIQNIRLIEQTQATLGELEQLTRRLTRDAWNEYLGTMSDEFGYVYDLNQITTGSLSGANGNDGALEKPLRVQGAEIGRLLVEATENANDEAVEILEAVSQQLSAHIENLRLLEETERGRLQLNKRANELATVSEVGTATATLLNPDELLQTVVDLTKSSFGLYHTHIYLLNEANDTLILSNGAGEIGYQMVIKGWHIPTSSKKSLVARAVRTRSGITANDVQADPEYLPNPLLPDTRSELAVPLIAGDEVLGVLDVQADSINYFSQDDISIYTTLASQVAVALQNARLYVEQAATVQRLRELDHLKSSFLANMSHELRTPLNSIIGFTEIILEGIDGPLTEFMEGDLKIIQKNGKHLLSLINDVLDMAKIEAGRMNLTYERFMLSELLEDVIDITTSLANDKELYLRVEGEDVSETELVADRVRLRQVLINIVGNAVKFTDKGGITLRSEKKDGKLWLKVIDTGMGIPPEKLENVFDHFSQLDTSTTRKAGGTGLGLPISRRLVELHQGELWAESTGVEGDGTIFNLLLPLENPSTTHPEG